MFKAIIESEARVELYDAAIWYEERKAGLGEEFLDEFLNVLDYLEDKPLLFSIINNDFRQVVMKKFPFVIVYRIVDSEIRIISVFHTSRNPKKKFK